MTFFSITDHFNCHYPSLRNFVFQYKHDFYNISYCSCHEKYDHLEWKLDLIKSVAKKINNPEKLDTYGISNISKSNNLANKIRDNKISELLETSQFEVCSIYCDNAGKDYFFGVKSDYLDHLSTLILYEDNAKKAFDSIKNTDIFNNEEKDQTVKMVLELMRYNKNEYRDLKDIQKIKLTKLLSKQFLKTLQ